MIEHHIQRTILQALSVHAQRFTELKPDGMDNGAFVYHLRQLEAAGYVQKVADRYELSSTGLAYVNSLSSVTKRPRQQPKLVAIIMMRHGDNLLLAYRKQAPSRHTWMLPSGKQHFGETPEAHIQRELSQLGIAASPRFRGVADIRIQESGDIVTHLSARLYDAVYTGDVPAETDRFRYEWLSLDGVGSVTLTPGTQAICDALRSTRGFVSLSLDAVGD